MEVTKPFAQEAELTEKLDRLSVSEQGTERAETFGQNVQKSERVADKSVQRISLKERLAEMQIRAAGGGIEKRMPQNSKGTEVSM